MLSHAGCKYKQYRQYLLHGCHERERPHRYCDGCVGRPRVRSVELDAVEVPVKGFPDIGINLMHFTIEREKREVWVSVLRLRLISVNPNQ